MTKSSPSLAGIGLVALTAGRHSSSNARSDDALRYQFFLSQRSLFVVVFDLTKGGDEDVLNWLQTIHTRTDAAVILVGTHLVLGTAQD